jgi:hypothetical protein
MKKAAGLTIIFTLVISLAIPIFIAAQNQSKWIKFWCYQPRYCPYEGYCTGEYATSPSMCEVQCWYTEFIERGWFVDYRCGSANCGGGYGGYDENIIERMESDFWFWLQFCI